MIQSFKVLFIFLFLTLGISLMGVSTLSHAAELTVRASTSALAEERAALPAPTVELRTGTVDPAAARRAPMDSNYDSLLSKIPPEALARMNAEQLAEIVSQEVKQPKSTPELLFNENIVVPCAVFGSFALAIFIFAYFSYRKRKDVMSTVQAAIQSGQALPDSFIASLEKTRKLPTAEDDLRRAVLLIAIGISAIVVLLVVGPGEGRKAAAIGVLPLLLGFSYLFLYKQSQKKSKNG